MVTVRRVRRVAGRIPGCYGRYLWLVTRDDEGQLVVEERNHDFLLTIDRIANSAQVQWSRRPDLNQGVITEQHDVTW